MKRLLIGATGLVGSHIVTQAAGRELGVLVRRPIADLPPDIRQYHGASSNDWQKRISMIAPDQLICCVGTTMKKAGGQVQFRAVDEHLVQGCARAARKNGARHMIVITSVGASERVDNIYLNAKGAVERGLTEIGFERLDIIRPGLLLGERTESRPAEAVGQMLAPLLNLMLLGSLRKFRAIDADTVARAIWKLAEQDEPGRFIHHNDELNALAG